MRPPLPTAAEIQSLQNLGYQNFQRYGADPVSMSTGNFSTSEATFTLSGVGPPQPSLRKAIVDAPIPNANALRALRSV